MSDFTAAVAPWLFGPSAGIGRGVAPQPPGMDGASGLLARFLAWFPGDPCGPNQHLTGIAAAVGLSAPSDAISALISVSGGDVFLSLDGLPASATNGLHVPSGAMLRLTGVPSLRSASFLQVAAGAIVDVIYFT